MIRRLCLMVRSPVLGQVKTRLAAAIGREQALRAYVRLVEDQLERLNPSKDIVRELWWTGTPSPLTWSWAERWGGSHHRQESGSLGERMLACLEPSGQSEQQACSTLVVGADVVGLDPQLLEDAWHWLEVTPEGWVFAPAEDGGYGLVGAALRARGQPLKQTPFDGIPWGTSEVMTRTLARCRALGIPWLETARVWDVDTVSDWQRYQREGPSASR